MTELPILVATVISTGAIVANRFVTVAGGQTAADGHALGVAQAVATAAGQPVPVLVQGIAVVEAGAAIAAGATIKSDASGRGITWATSGAKLGVALGAATAAGEKIPVVLTLSAP